MRGVGFRVGDARASHRGTGVPSRGSWGGLGNCDLCILRVHPAAGRACRPGVHGVDSGNCDLCILRVHPAAGRACRPGVHGWIRGIAICAFCACIPPRDGRAIPGFMGWIRGIAICAFCACIPPRDGRAVPGFMGMGLQFVHSARASHREMGVPSRGSWGLGNCDLCILRVHPAAGRACRPGVHGVDLGNCDLCVLRVHPTARWACRPGVHGWIRGIAICAFCACIPPRDGRAVPGFMGWIWGIAICAFCACIPPRDGRAIPGFMGWIRALAFRDFPDRAARRPVIKSRRTQLRPGHSGWRRRQSRCLVLRHPRLCGLPTQRMGGPAERHSRWRRVGRCEWRWDASTILLGKALPDGQRLVS